MTATPRRILALFGSAVLFGQERGNLEALSALKAQGCEILCLVRDDKWNVTIPAALEAKGLPFRKTPYIEQRLPGRTFQFLFRNPLAIMSAHWAFWRAFKEFRPTHIYAFNQIFVLNFLLGLALTRTPLVYRSGDLPTLHHPVFRLTWSFVVHRAIHFVAISKFVKRKLIEVGVSASRISIIYNRPPTRLTMDNAYGERGPGTGLRIVYIGQLTEAKGVHMLVDAFRKVAPLYPEARLLIAGRISDWAGDEWARDLAKRVSIYPVIGQHIEFLGYVEDIFGLLGTSQVHVCPSLWEEPLGNVVMEAKAAGVPSIVFPSGGLPELVEHGATGLVCAEKSADCLADALRFYLDDPTRASTHGLAAHASLSFFQVDQFAQRWEHVIQEAVA